MRDKQTGNVYNGKREEKFKTLKNWMQKKIIKKAMLTKKG